ncbi:MAG: glucosaminidase domain-containing protein [Candidatus Solibacter usitatus]|nr:glucosaminidase domain-containing protein [Candidatus Solibacter usitatus]
MGFFLGLFLTLGWLAAHAPAAALQPDPRLAQLQKFFKKYNCPVGKLAPSFLRAADQYRIDWRILPSIALVESGGGRRYRRNNIFGWANGRVGFKSIDRSIYLVADKLANSKYYRGKSLQGVLATYNPVPGYVETVQRVMAELSVPPRSIAFAD